MQFIKILSVSILAILLLVMVSGYFLLNDMCANTIAASIASSTRKAILFERDCGATTGFSTQISIVDLNDKLDNDAGNIFIADGKPDGCQLNWSGEQTLNVAGTKGRKIYKKTAYFDDVNIIYE